MQIEIAKGVREFGIVGICRFPWDFFNFSRRQFAAQLPGNGLQNLPRGKIGVGVVKMGGVTGNLPQRKAPME
jgi:hypothetical protein